MTTTAADLAVTILRNVNYGMISVKYVLPTAFYLFMSAYTSGIIHEWALPFHVNNMNCAYDVYKTMTSLGYMFFPLLLTILLPIVFDVAYLYESFVLTNQQRV